MSSVIKSYSFVSLDGSSESELKEKSAVMSFQEIESGEKRLDPKVITLERKNADNSAFEIDVDVENHRGIVENRIAEERNKINSIVEKEIQVIKKQTINNAFQEGITKAHEEVWQKEQTNLDMRLGKFDELVSKIESYSAEIMQKQEEHFLDMLRSISKWMIKKESLMTEDYLSDLVKKIISDQGNKEKIVFHYSPDVENNYTEELEKLNNHYKENDKIEFFCNQNLKDDEMEVELNNSFLHIGPQAQLEIIDQIFDQLKEENGV